MSREPNEAFYLIHSRAWELLIGSILAHLPVTKFNHSKVLSNAVSAFGFVSIFATVLLYDDKTTFPAYGALIPTLSTAVIIWANGHSLTLIGKILSHKSLVGIGLVSYSLYLWHWPIMALHFGDSHAEALYPAFKKAFTNKETAVLHASSSGCLPLPGSELYKGSDCPDFNAYMLNVIQKQTIKHVVLSSAWSNYIYGALNGDDGLILTNDLEADKNPEMAKLIFEKHLVSLHNYLKENNIQLWLIKPVPEHDRNIPHQLTRLAMKKKPTETVGIALKVYQERNRFVLGLFDKLAREGVNMIDPIPYLCNDSFCSGAKGEISMYKDDDHLSVEGSKMLAPMLDLLVKRLANKA